MTVGTGEMVTQLVVALASCIKHATTDRAISLLDDP